MNPRKKLREILARKTYTVVPGAYDTLTARLVQVAGFEAVYLTGGGYSRANGYPDIGLITMSEVTAWISGVTFGRGAASVRSHAPLTAAALNGVPSENFTSGRSLKVHTL